MAYEGITNNSPFEVELVIHPDLNMNDQLIILVKATYEIVDPHTIKLAENQLPINLAGRYTGEPGTSSLLYPSECCIEKCSTDIYMHGHAQTPDQKPHTVLDVSLRVGEVSKLVRVFGNRVWQFKTYTEGGVERTDCHISEPQPFTTMPLIYENAFGGQDNTPEDDKNHVFDERNFVGKGIITEHSQHADFVQLPNLEDPSALIQSYTDQPAPAGFGPIPGEWLPRRQYAGTYDEQWEKERKPLLPTDFDPKFFNAAHPDLIAPNFLLGNEEVDIFNASSLGRLKFNLPAEIPGISVQMVHEKPKLINTLLDSIMINTDNHTVELLWRATYKIQNQIADLEKINVWERNYLKQQCKAAASA